MEMSPFLNAVRFVPLTYFFKGVTFLGNKDFLYIFLPLLYWCWKKRGGRNLFILVIISAYLNFLLKQLFAWDRPPTELWLVSANGFSFPSAHAVMAVVIWGYLAHEVRKTWFTISAVLLVILISLSRVYLGVHYPRDVVAGIGVGLAFLYAYRWAGRWVIEYLKEINPIFSGLIAAAIAVAMLLPFHDPDAAISSGVFAGFTIGTILEPHFADFDAHTKWYFQIVKGLLGMLILLAISQGCNWIFPSNQIFLWFEFFLVGNWIAYGAPWLFVQLRLAARE